MSDLSIDQGQAEAGTTITSSPSLPPLAPANDDDAGLAGPLPATPIAAPTAAQPPITTNSANDEADLSWLGPLIHDGTETASQADCPDTDPVTVPVPTTPETLPPRPPPPASNSSHPASSTVPCPQALRHTPSYAAAPNTSQNNNNNTNTAITSFITSPSPDSTENKPHTNNNDNNNNKIARRNTLESPPNTDPLIASPNLVSSHQTRKLSPGLAARLKALGLGASKKLSYATTVSDRIGKLSEEQIRQIEESHHRHSAAENLVIERRGKPWKGVVRIPSKSSLKSTKSAKDDAITPEDIDVPTIRIVDSPPPAEDTPDLCLDGFEVSEAIDMDTNKFRLPDHVNGNGTKVTVEMRQEHIARDTISPLSPDESPMPPPSSPPPAEEPLSPQDDVPPPPPPAKDTPPLPAEPFSPQEEDFFNPLGLQRPGSVYTISRASFANQLEQLTSLQLPDAESLAGKVAAIPTAQAAVRALIGAAEQIRSWISKASEVISGLDSDDDVEWSAAGGREGLEEVENATSRFAGLIDVYVTAIEELQTRNDIANVSTDDLTRAVMQMEAIMEEWTNIRSTLRSVRGQVEIAMEWEELWDGVLGEIESELSELRRLVFEMEERRHKSAMATANGDLVDMGDLRTIMEETRSANSRARPPTNRFSLAAVPTSPRSPSPNGLAISADDSSVLALFARMQPLRASLDFLPMRLSTFEARADASFPSACEELEMRREALEASFKKLQKDADGLRKELGEDRWVLVFRGAARQAEKMTDSVDRSVAGLREAVDAGMHLTNQPNFLKKIESYEAKKTHYGPAIDRVLLIIERGVKDRLTVNGEILRLHTEMQTKWQDIKKDMKETDIVLNELHTDKWGTNLRDSISSMLSNEVSSTAGSGLETPYSSPPSSVIMSGLGASVRTPGSKSNTSATRVRRSSSSVSGGLSQSGGGRRATTATTPAIKRKPVPQASTYSGASSSPVRGTKTTTISSSNRSAASITRPASTLAHRPRWNGSTKTSDLDVGYTFKPLSLTTPTPYAKYKNLTTPIRSHSSLAAPMNSTSSSRLPMRSSRATSPSPMPDTPPRPVSKLNLPQIRSVSSSNRRKSLMRPGAEELGMAPRPATSLATTNRRTSMLPMPKFRKEVTTAADGGRASPMPTAFSSRLGLVRGSSSTPTGTNDRVAKDNKPRWRHG